MKSLRMYSSAKGDTGMLGFVYPGNCQTVFSGLSMLKEFFEWSQDNPMAMAVVSGAFTLFDFGLCFWSGKLYAPMSEHEFSAATVYGDLW